jgi:hypothetical protein
MTGGRTTLQRNNGTGTGHKQQVLGKNGGGIKFLTELENFSYRSSDLHFGRAEVGTESLLSRFINLQINRQKFICLLVQEKERLEEISVSENQSKWVIVFG